MILDRVTLWIMIRCVYSSVSEGCAVLNSLRFRQHEAPTDILGVLKSVTELINDESAVPVEDVQISWLGDAIHAAIGSYEIVANVTHSDKKRRCYATLVQVHDTNECVTSGQWRHKCHPSAECINTEGSYYCACKSPNFAPLDAPHGCGGRSNTSACCDQGDTFEQCVTSFSCLADECETMCARNAASCKRIVKDLDEIIYGPDRKAVTYVCACPEGYIGTGRACPHNEDPPLVYVDATGASSIPCGCQLRRRDPCVGMKCGEHARCVPISESTAKCECLAGFHAQEQEAQKLECIDDTLPSLSLRGPASVYLTQCGAAYDELGVDVVDENAAAFERTLRIAYSDASLFPHRNRGGQNQVPYFKTGSYKVNYRVDTPWTTPPFIEAKRRVTVVDEDECNLSLDHPCTHHCAPVATCVNELGSGYRCECPAGTIGDGFRNISELPSFWTSQEESWRIPSGFSDGSGCLDVRPPTLHLLGANPRILQIEKCDSSQTLLKRFAPFLNDKQHPIQPNSSQNERILYQQQITQLVQLAPHVLCDMNQPELCYSAHDVSPYSGESIDLKSQVKIGYPQPLDSNDPHLIKFGIPYTVTDDAGNTASATRQVIIRTLTLDDLQTEIEAKNKQCPKCNCPKCPPRPQCPKCTPPSHDKQVCPTSSESKPCPPCPICPTCPKCSATRERTEQIRSLEQTIETLEQRVYILSAATALAVVIAFAFAVALLSAQSQVDAQSMPQTNNTPIRLVDTPISHGRPSSGPYDSPFPPPTSVSSRRGGSNMMRNSSPWS
mmetsp:Transcript_18401/g.23940  ORF Transcript_18401/g.23940 Transcript_18401/m.23940 type:complete len:782 (+) Transcript_18401:3-2348(+)